MEPKKKKQIMVWLVIWRRHPSFFLYNNHTIKFILDSTFLCLINKWSDSVFKWSPLMLSTNLMEILRMVPRVLVCNRNLFSKLHIIFLFLYVTCVCVIWLHGRAHRHQRIKHTNGSSQWFSLHPKKIINLLHFPITFCYFYRFLLPFSSDWWRDWMSNLLRSKLYFRKKEIRNQRKALVANTLNSYVIAIISFFINFIVRYFG